MVENGDIHRSRKEGSEASFEIIRAPLNQLNLPMFRVKIAESEKMSKNIHENILTQYDCSTAEVCNLFHWGATFENFNNVEGQSLSNMYKIIKC